MKRSALVKDIFRDIKKSLGRFLSIVGIVSLGVAFFSGLKIAPEDMRYTADKYYDDYRLMDLRIVSNLGLSQGDLEAIDAIEGVETSFGTYSLDALTEVKDREIVVKVHGYESQNQINAPRLIEGRYPQAPDECLIEYNKEGYLNIEIGSQLDLKSGKEEDLETDLLNTSYKVVGKVNSPYYLSFEKGSTNIGNGEVRDFIMIPQSNFKSEIFTDIFVTIEGARELNSYQAKYFDQIEPSKKGIEKLAKEREIVRYEELLKDIREEVNEGKDKYHKEEEKAHKELDKARLDLEKGGQELEKASSDLNKKEKEFYQSINKGKEDLKNAQKDMEDGERELAKALEDFNNMKKSAQDQIKKAEEELEKGEAGLLDLEEKIQTIEKALENPMLPEEERHKLEAEYEGLKVMVAGLREDLDLGRKELDKNKADLDHGEKELEGQKKLLEEGRLKLEKEKKGLEKLERETEESFKSGRQELEKAKKDLEEGQREYDEAKEEVSKELADAWKEITDAEKKIKDIEKAKWYVLDRDSHYSYVDYGGAADRIDSLAKVFPLFFALVAALVSLTTMTRMVDEQRVNIGTLKALGYSRREIVAKYIVYALLASLLGCIIGISIGYTLFPTVIFNAYGMMYQLPPVILRFNKTLVFYISIVTMGLITSTSYLATSSELKENSASLMRPKAPRLGKKILIEKIDFIWKRFNFSNKVTIRNIFRYKRRFFMTVFGIAGSTALILTGFGVRDSIRTIVDRQYGSLFNYDMTIGIEEEFEDDLWDNEKILDYSFIHREGASVENKSKEIDISLVVPENRDDIAKFIKLYDRKKDERIKIPKEGAIISEQIGKLLNVKIGEEILLKNSEDELARIKISGITENYTFNYVYLSSDYYDSIFDSSLRYEEILANTGDLSREEENKLSKEIVMKDNINSVSFTSSLRDNFQDTIDSLNYVVLIMIVSAGALAFVVLYNLTNINISERIREIATIKVLGFYDGEVSEYIYRENIILTIIGTMVGLVMGIFLHRYIMLTVEMENIMFGLKLDIRSYIYAILITFLFSIIVNFAMHFRLKNVEMVESLKSVD